MGKLKSFMFDVGYFAIDHGIQAAVEKFHVDEEEVKLKPHDVVVQRRTNHAWVNHGTEPALLIAVLIDSSLV